MNLIAAAIIGIAIIVLLIAVCKVHPFLSLLAGSFAMAVCAGVEYDKAFDSFTSGVGSTIANVGLLIAFGSIIGTILFKSGGADTIVDTIMSKTPLQRLPWAMALIAFIVGIPMFFEVGVVILIPVVLFAARRAKAPVVLLGIPALAGLSTLHAFVPPHPGPLTAIGALNANLGITLALGLIVAIPTVIISGPLFGKTKHHCGKLSEQVTTPERRPYRVRRRRNIISTLLPKALHLPWGKSCCCHFDCPLIWILKDKKSFAPGQGGRRI